MSAWNYTLRRLSDEDVERYARMSWPCSWPKCKETQTHEATFDSVTGRAGRVNTRRKLYCPEHAARFAEKHGLTVEASA